MTTRKLWKLDTGNDGCDQVFVDTEKANVIADVMHHHDLKHWPLHWTVTPLHENCQLQFSDHGAGRTSVQVFSGAELVADIQLS